jgi:hypothetical protein
VAPTCIGAFFLVFISSNYTTYESSTRVSNLFGVHPDFFLRGEGCEQVIGFPGLGVFVVIRFAAGQLWNSESAFNWLIGFVEYLNFVGGDLINLGSKRYVESL